MAKRCFQLYKPEKSFKCLKKSHIQFLALALRDLPVHWLLTPTIDKQPVEFEWQKHPFTPESLFEQLNTCGQVRVKSKLKGSSSITPTGFAIVCGQNSLEYLIAIDCDGERVHKAIPTLPPTVAFTSGRPGRAQYLYKTTIDCDRLRSRKIAITASEKLELRGTGHSSVLPPSKHPITGKYYWLPGRSPQQIDVAPIPDFAISQMLVTPPIQKVQTAVDLNCYAKSQKGEENRALHYLQKIPAHFADDYHSWIQIGMALKSVSPDLLDAWDKWSQQSPKYKPGECQWRWQSFKNLRSTVGTLYYFAHK